MSVDMGALPGWASPTSSFQSSFSWSGLQMVSRIAPPAAPCLSLSQNGCGQVAKLCLFSPGPGRGPWERKSSLSAVSTGIMTLFMGWVESSVRKHWNYFYKDGCPHSRGCRCEASEHDHACGRSGVLSPSWMGWVTTRASCPPVKETRVWTPGQKVEAVGLGLQ